MNTPGEILWIAAALSTLAAAQDPKPAFSIAISAQQTVVGIGEAVTLKVILTNTSDQGIPVSLDLCNSAETSGFRIEVRDAAGNTPLITEYYDGVTGHKVPREKVKISAVHREFVCVGGGGLLRVNPEPDPSLGKLGPGKSLEFSTDVSTLYDLEKGAYTIWAERNLLDAKAPVRSNTITVIVTP